ncbi:hypothetical protein L249_2459 [Ophiocordyceps polyrhachis-furcata BCC 54312]|uniref:Defective in cullin neddylation protein n=1 Tax=Ophiocordyceps polyrhachis-furcata BCC 54312 TaxID=1330021 RepID=A0A367LPQ1_9HYPO|nr:hypothetical protein L249_2459 [Ophiocordyceps polyrhachis-furcata BCC 54312]
MAPASSAQQKSLIAQFVALTGASDRQASRYLRLAGNKINDAVDSRVPLPPPILNNLPPCQLQPLTNQVTDEENDEADKLEVNSTMDYLGSKLKVNLENAELLVILELLQAPSVGEISRRGFVDGWKAAGVGAAYQEHAAHVRRLISSLSSDLALFKRVYRYTFVVGRDQDQKSLSVENALIYWGMLFAPPGRAWKTKMHDWFELWKRFLEEKWTRSVNKDMWNMTLEFALKSTADESLSFWNEDGAWPTVIDDFVMWSRDKVAGKSESVVVVDD